MTEIRNSFRRSSDTSNEDYFLDDINSTNSHLTPFQSFDDLSTVTLIEAILAEDIETLQQLLEEGRCLRYCNDRGCMPLHLAVEVGNIDILNLLLKYPEIDVNLVNNMGETCLFSSLNLKRPKELILALINGGCDVNIPNVEHDSTPLHLATTYSYLDVAESLIKRGADIDARDYCGFTPLHEAVLKSNVEMVQMLLYYGADANEKCDANLTPFMRAVSNPYCQTIALELLEYEADFNNVSHDGVSTLFMALNCANPISYELVRRGADVNYISPEGYTSLEVALSWNRATLFKVIWPIIDKELLLNTVDRPFLYTYLFACRFQSDEWVECLYDVLSSDIALDLVDRYVTYAEVSDDPSCLFQCAINAFVRKNVPKKNCVELIYILLSLGMPVTISDIFDVYGYYGYNEELEAFLFMDIQPSQVRMQTCKNLLIPRFAVDFSLNVTSCLSEFLSQNISNSHVFMFLKTILQLVEFCTPTKQFRDAYFKLIPQISERPSGTISSLNENVLQKLDTMEDIPSLLELSRNASRLYINSKCKIQNSCNFHTFLRNLEIPHRLKDIIRFKSALYN